MPLPVTEAHEPTLLLHAERLAVATRRVPDQVVRVATETRTREVPVEATLTHDGVLVEHVAIGRYVDAAPPVRQDGDLTIVPVVEEQVVVTRRLFLREEVHIRRVRSSVQHRETVTLREQQAVVTRTSPQPGTPPVVDHASPMHRNDAMPNEIIVAVYDTPAHAQLAVADIEIAGIAHSAISQHRATASETDIAGTTGTVQEPGFWSRLFGGETDYDHAVYDRSMQAGSTVVSVNVGDTQAAEIMKILESHSPIDIDERASGYGLSTAAATAPMAAAPLPATGSAASADTIQLAEESLTVGKRLVNRGGTRIRRYVVETPVEQAVTLHSERVVLDRHPVTDGRAVGDASFTDKAIEMLETAEEAVVTKTAHVVEEVSLRKEASDRVETVHDTVRREDVAIEQVPAGSATNPTLDGKPSRV